MASKLLCTIWPDAFFLAGEDVASVSGDQRSAVVSVTPCMVTPTVVSLRVETAE